jgi:phosphoribosylanthranilate isomerase
MIKTKIKFCGITSVEDYLFINDLIDVNLIGMIFTNKSPRCLSIESANKILKSTKRQKSIVGIFMDQSEDAINNILKEVDLDILQFHGDETLDFCKSFNKPFIKTLHITDQSFLYNSDFNKNANYFLLDTSIDNKHGGTGKKFDWDLLSKNITISDLMNNSSCFVAGGLNPSNVSELIIRHKPYGIDVSSGIESSIGKKDHLLMKKFIENVRISEKENYEKN